MFILCFGISAIFAFGQKTENPFSVGQKLKWKSSARQNGKVAFDQINFKNRAAGAVRLDGEIKEDGKFYLFNKKWKET